MPADDVRAAKAAYEGAIFARANVVGVAIGNKVIRGRETDERCIVVFVEAKKPEAQLRHRDVVPKTFGNVRTDIVETGRFHALRSEQAIDLERTKRTRPAPGGVSIGHVQITAGTLGVLARRNGRPVILSNNHVLANQNAGRVGDPILQPGPADGGRLQDTIARLVDFVPIQFKEREPGPVARFLARLFGPLLRAAGWGLKRLPSGHSNLVDAAVAQPIETRLVAPDILGIGRVRGTKEPDIGMRVRKSGRTTGVTEGRITAIDAVVEVDYGGPTAIFREQIVSDLLSKGGDSGSLVVDEVRHAAHLLFAGPAGTGKTTSAIALARDMFGEDWRQNYFELNSSDERGIETVRTKVKEIARLAPFGGTNFKIIFLDEADNLTADAQAALRRTMETYSKTSRFILSANYSSRLIEPIQSRTAVFRFRPLKPEAIAEYIGRIAKAEKLKITDEGMEALVYVAEGDMRRAVNALQVAASLGSTVDADVLYKVSSTIRPEEVKGLIEKALEGEFLRAREVLDKLLIEYGLSGEDIVRQLHRTVFDLNIPDESKVRLLDRIGETDFRLTEGSSERIQIESLLAHFALIGQDLSKK